MEAATAASATRATGVWACIVAFHPRPGAIRALVAALAAQVEQVLVIDNSPGAPTLGQDDLAGALHVPMPSNAGTAGAMNEAWRRALAAGAQFMVSFDQDSVPPPGLVTCLLASYRASSTPPLAAIGPAWKDARTGRRMRLLKPVKFLRHHVTAESNERVIVDHVITSGCLISAQAYRAVGEFDETLFLDYVDVEWCLRARSLGLASAVATSCTMEHAIGEKMILIAGRQLAVHSPRRTYLQVRNHALLWRKAWMPVAWLFSDMLQVVLKAALLLAVGFARIERTKAICQGLFDGISGRSGPPR